MIDRNENDSRTNHEIVFSYVLDLHNFLRNPTMGLEKHEWLSLKKLIASCEELIDEKSI